VGDTDQAAAGADEVDDLGCAGKKRGDARELAQADRS
jgi:hypothetical protein